MFLPVLLLLAGTVLVGAQPPPIDLGTPEIVAEGVALYRLGDPALVDPPGPIAIQLLELDPERVDLRVTLGHDVIGRAESVPDMVARTGAIAGVNAGFFDMSTGEPAGLVKIAGELVSDAARARGAVGILRREPIELLFDQVSTRTLARLRTGEREARITVNGINTPPRRGRLVLFTPRFGESTPPSGALEWLLGGAPLAVIGRQDGGGTRIPRDGAVLSVIGTPPNPLDLDARATIAHEYRTRWGTEPARWEAAGDITNGAGLLIYDDEPVTDWTAEQLAGSFVEMRHPRTIIGTDDDDDVWLITVDGRNPDRSVGMTLVEARALAVRVGLEMALNLDGGGSTTMVVKGKVMNRPSDPTGPRRVSDGLLVFSRTVAGERRVACRVRDDAQARLYELSRRDVKGAPEWHLSFRSRDTGDDWIRVPLPGAEPRFTADTVVLQYKNANGGRIVNLDVRPEAATLDVFISFGLEVNIDTTLNEDIDRLTTHGPLTALACEIHAEKQL